MLVNYQIIMPEVKYKLKYGFNIYEKTNIILDKALTLLEISLKYPNALSIKQV